MQNSGRMWLYSMRPWFSLSDSSTTHAHMLIHTETYIHIHLWIKVGIFSMIIFNFLLVLWEFCMVCFDSPLPTTIPISNVLLYLPSLVLLSVVLKIHQCQFMLPKYSWICGLPLKHNQTLQLGENWLYPWAANNYQ